MKIIFRSTLFTVYDITLAVPLMEVLPVLVIKFANTAIQNKFLDMGVHDPF